MSGLGRVRSLHRVQLLELAPLVVGFAALAVATTLGWDSAILSAIVSPPAVARIALAAAAVTGAVMLLGAAVARMEDRAGSGGHLVAMLRGIRLAFLAVAAFAVAIGWALGSPLPFIVALIIAGIDVIETSFLLIVVHRESR
jgi:hypothetical protein